MKAIDWTKIYKKYKGQWITLADDEITVLSNAATADEALTAAKRNGFKSPILHRVPNELITFVGVDRYLAGSYSNQGTVY